VLCTVVFAVHGRSRFRAEAGVGVGAEDGGSAREGDATWGSVNVRGSTPVVLHIALPASDKSSLRAEGDGALETVAARGEVVNAVRAIGAAAPCAEYVRGRVEDAEKRVRERTGSCLLQTSLVREEAVKAALAMGNSHGASCRRRR
jgi:hypothetical protein